MSDARVIKTRDEISLLNHSAMMVDVAYDELYRAMQPGMKRKRSRRPGEQSALRHGLGVCRSGERHFRRALLPASARFLRPQPAPRRSGLLRHSAFLHGLSHLLLPHVQHRLRAARHGGRLQALPRLHRCVHRADPPRPHHRASGFRVAEGERVRLPQRGSLLRRCSSGTASAWRSGKSR